MKRVATILLFVLVSVIINAQKQITTIVPQAPVVVGEAFQVQYVVEDAAKASNFNTPVFQGFYMASGPNIYPGTTTGNSNRQSKNFVFTLVALRSGRLVIPGADIMIDGRLVRSNNSFVEVISKEAAIKRLAREMSDNSDYFLRPGENVQDKIRQNLFLKVMVDKRNCFVGQPVLATFKLYSRLESKSDIVKNPGFYGFTVHDIVNLADKQMVTERVNGKAFDVHTIRKVQLYPLQAGVFIIDPMEVKNKVEFSGSVVNKKTEQEIIEGVLANNELDETKENTEEFESNMSTEPITITVKPFPEKAKPILFDGATGIFTISAVAMKNKLSGDKGDVLEVVISGKGNFIQLNAPVVQWPNGIEGFEPSVEDALDKSAIPLTGRRTYRYAFVAARPGKYIIPPLSFSFFNPDSGNYKTVTTNTLQVNINEKETGPATINTIETKKAEGKNTFWFFISAGMLLIFSSLFWFLKRRKTSTNNEMTKQAETKIGLSVEQALAPALSLINAEDKLFYSSLNQSIWKYFGFHFKLSGSEMNKENIVAGLKGNKIKEELIAETNSILQQCEAGVFTNANMSVNKTVLLDKTREVLEKINESLL